MTLSVIIKEFIHENLNLTLNEDNVIIIHSESDEFQYSTNSLSEELILNVLSFVSRVTLDNKFKILSIVDEEIYILNNRYDMQFEVYLSETESSIDIYNKVSKTIDLLDNLVDTHPKLNIFGVNESQQIVVENDDWRCNVFFDYEDLDTFIDEINAFFNFKYNENRCLYGKDYIEYVIDFPELKSLFGYMNLPEVFSPEAYENKIYYEITKISLPLFNLIMKDQEYGDEEDYQHHENLSLKVYNINSVLDILVSDPNFADTALKITKNFLFKLSMKYNINLNIVEENIYEIDAEDIVSTLSEKLEMVQKSDLVYNHEYDADLIQYYYQASLMEDSPFKYLAYYQVIECIYDEVLMANTVGDIQQLINSNWFNSNDKADIQKIIDKIKWHNNSKKDEDKLKLVMDKYFRNNASDDIFLEVNKEIIDLCKKMKIIKDESEFKDLQKLQKKIYRYRCDCTHSNRKYPISKVEDGNSIQDYIKLIRLIAERIILNYR